MIELIFVIVVIGILASIAIPRLWVTRDDAMIAKGRSEVSTIRSSILTFRQRNLLEGNASYPAALDAAAINTEDEALFGTLFDYPVFSQNRNGHWMKTGANQYIYRIMDRNVLFTYTPATGRFECNASNANPTGDLCRQLTR